MKDFLRITLPTLVVMLIITELVLWTIPVKDPYEEIKVSAIARNYIPSRFQPNSRFNFTSNEGLPYVDSATTFSTNNAGFRGDDISEKPDTEEYRVFLLGGSTMECLYLDDTHSIDRLLHAQLKELNVKVYNAGKSGDMSVDHVAMLAHRIIHLQPDLVVLCCGLNDLRRVRYDYSHAVDPSVTGGGWLYDTKYLLSNLQIYRRIYYVLSRTSRDAEEISLQTNYRESVSYLNSLPYGDTLPQRDLSAYRRNLNSIIGMCREHDVDLLLITQASTWNSDVDKQISRWHWLSFVGEYRYTGDIMEQSLDEYNNVMRDLASISGIPLYDLARDIPKSSYYFYDDCHFNNNGSAFFAGKVSSCIRESFFTDQGK